MISGATYVGVPHTVYKGPSTTVARPKSPSFNDLVPSGYSDTWNETRAQLKPSEQLGFFFSQKNDASIKIYQQVLWFNVSVDDVDAVQVLQSSSEIVHHERGIPLRVFSRGGDGIE